jgi:hypothetical protein
MSYRSGSQAADARSCLAGSQPRSRRHQRSLLTSHRLPMHFFLLSSFNTTLVTQPKQGGRLDGLRLRHMISFPVYAASTQTQYSSPSSRFITSSLSSPLIILHRSSSAHSSLPPPAHSPISREHISLASIASQSSSSPQPQGLQNGQASARTQSAHQAHHQLSSQRLKPALNARHPPRFATPQQMKTRRRALLNPNARQRDKTCES